MKLLYSVILLISILQNASSVSNISQTAAEIVEYYKHEYELFTQEICPKLENISNEILKDIIVQISATPLMQSLKRNLTEYQRYYPYFKRFGLNGTLILEFSDLVKDFYDPKHHRNDEVDFLYIKQLLKKFGYDDIREQYTNKFKIFVDEKFYVKFDKVQTELNNNLKTYEQDHQVIKWIGDLKECQDYECFLNDFDNYKRNQAGLFNLIFVQLFRAIFKGLVVQAYNTTVFAREVLKDAKLLQLSTPIQQQLSRNLQDIAKLQDTFYEVQQIYLFSTISYHILYKFDDYASISFKDRQLITEIFNEHDYKSLHFEDNKGELAKTDYINQYEHKKAKLAPKELQELNVFMPALQQLINASDHAEKVKAKKVFENVLSQIN